MKQDDLNVAVKCISKLTRYGRERDQGAFLKITRNKKINSLCATMLVLFLYVFWCYCRGFGIKGMKYKFASALEKGTYPASENRA